MPRPPSARAAIAIVAARASEAAAVARSVASALAQSEPALDVLLVGPEPVLAALTAGDARVRRVPARATTLGGLLQAALREARAPYVCLLRAGEVLDEAALARHLEAIEAYPPPAASLARSVRAGEAAHTAPSRGNALRATLRGSPPALGAALLRRDHALAAGGFDDTFAACAADDFWLRFLARHAVRGIDEALLHGAEDAAPAVPEVVAAERGRALTRAFAAFSQDELLAASSDGAWLDPGAARLDLARDVLGAGVAEARVLAHELVDEALRRGCELPDEPAFAALRDLLPELARSGLPLEARLGGQASGEPCLAPAPHGDAFPRRLGIAVWAPDAAALGAASLLERAYELRGRGIDVLLLGDASEPVGHLDAWAASGARVEVLPAATSADEVAAVLDGASVGALLVRSEGPVAAHARGCGVVLLERTPPSLDVDELARTLRRDVLAAAAAQAEVDDAEHATTALAAARATGVALRLAADGIVHPESVTGRVGARAGWTDEQRQELAGVAREAESLAALAPLVRLRSQRILDKLRIGHRLGSSVRALRARLGGGGADRVKSLDARALDRFLAAAARTDGWLWVVYATDPYSETRGQRSTWITRELARRGHRVIYFYWRWRLGDDILASGDERVLSVPIDQLPAIQGKVLRVQAPGLRKVLLAEFPDVALFERVDLFAAHGFVTVYDCIDDWAEFSRVGQAYWYDAAVERHLARNADVVVATHPRLAADLEASGERVVPLVPNGVDLDSLRADEAPRAPSASTVVGYFGHLTPSWFDWELIRDAAARNPEWRFEIVGYGQAEDLEVPANVTLPGMVPHDRLAAQTAAWTVAVIPFREGRLTQAVDPVKLYEYLALGLPVVAVGMAHLRDVPGVVVCERDGFDDALHRATATPLDRAAVAAFVADSRWSRRVDALLDHVESADTATNVVTALAG